LIHFFKRPMAEDDETVVLDTELTRLAVDVRQMIQDFPLCSTFREIDQQNALVRGQMEGMREKLARLDTLAMEELDMEKAELVSRQADRHREQLVAVQRQFRQANVKAMTLLETQSTRELLGKEGEGGGVRQRRDKEQMVKEHGAVTQSLQAISRQLAETVERSKLTVSSLEGSSRTVEEVGEEHRNMSGVIGQSKKLITKYARREFTDKVLIMFALAFFFAVVLYILRKRVFPTYGPIELIFYLFGGFGSVITNIINVFTSVASLWA